MPLYKSIVHPHFDYCTPVWSPHLTKEFVKLEKVQRKAKIIRGSVALSRQTEKARTFQFAKKAEGVCDKGL